MKPAAAEVKGGAIGTAGVEAYRQNPLRDRIGLQQQGPGWDAVESDASAAESKNVPALIAQPEYTSASQPITTNDTASSAKQATLKDLQNPMSNQDKGMEPTEGPDEAQAQFTPATRVDTISNLHFPGEFPKGKIPGDTS